jgi:hypothetical protein
MIQTSRVRVLNLVLVNDRIAFEEGKVTGRTATRITPKRMKGWERSLVVGLAHGFKVSQGLLLGVVQVIVYLGILRLFRRGFLDVVEAKCRIGPSHAVSEIARTGRVSREGQDAIHKTLLGRSSWSVIPQLSAQWDTRGLSFCSPNRRPRRT